MAGREWTAAELAILEDGARNGMGPKAITRVLHAEGYADRTWEAVRLKKDRRPKKVVTDTRAEPFTVDRPPSDAPPIDDLLDRRRRAFERKFDAQDGRKLIGVQVNISGPVAIAHFGDPHIDDDGCNLPLLERHIEVVRKTPGMFAGNVGDTTNNWVGRLARLYAEQSTTAAEAWQLAEWLVRSMRWLYMVGGNHDAWSGAGDPLKWIAKQADALYQVNGVRMALNFPNGRTVRINARHDFKGHSQWNSAHGPAKAAQMGWRDHVLTCGHLHISGYQVVKDPASGLISHAIRTASYKMVDRYADTLGLPDQNIFVCPVTIIDPQYADDDPRLVTTIFDPEEASEYLTWKRKRAA